MQFDWAKNSLHLHMELFYFEHISIKISIDRIYLLSIFSFVTWSRYMLLVLIVSQGKALIDSNFVDLYRNIGLPT